MASSSSAGKPDIADDEAVSAAKPDISLAVGFYNIGWTNSRFNQLSRHKRTLEADIGAALDEFHTDVLLLSECGEVGKGLRTDMWLPMVRGICGPGFDVQHQGLIWEVAK